MLESNTSPLMPDAIKRLSVVCSGRSGTVYKYVFSLFVLFIYEVASTCGCYLQRHNERGRAEVLGVPCKGLSLQSCAKI